MYQKGNNMKKAFNLHDLRHVSAISLGIDNHDYIEGQKVVLLYIEDDIGAMKWWPIFQGSESECRYFKDNFNIGLTKMLENNGEF